MAEVFGLVGALSAVPRRVAARDAARHGWTLTRGTTRTTTHAVFGRRLLDRMDEAAIAARVEQERAAGRELLSENAFLRRLAGAAPTAGGDLKLQTLLDRSGLPRTELGLLVLFDAFESGGEPFSLRDVMLARTYAGLRAGGAGWSAIARSVHRGGAAVSLTAAALKVGGRNAIYAEAQEGLCELDGQLLLGFAEAEADADALFDAAEAAEARGAPAEAAKLYGRCLALDPTDAIAAFNRANCLRRAGREEEAEREYLRAVRHDPTLVEAWFNLAGLLSDAGRTETARRHLERAVREDPGYADAVFNLAALAFDSDDHAAARRWWERYLELDPHSDWARTAARGLRYLAATHASVG